MDELHSLLIESKCPCSIPFMLLSTLGYLESILSQHQRKLLKPIICSFDSSADMPSLHSITQCLEYSRIPMAGLEGTLTHLTPPHPLGSPSGSSHFPSLFSSQSCQTGCSACLSHAQVKSQLKSQYRVITWPNRLLEEMAALPHKRLCEVRSSLPVLLAC